RKFFERCEELWLQQPGPAYWLKHFRNESQAVIVPSSDCRVLRKLLNEAMELAADFRMAGGADGRMVGDKQMVGIPEVRMAGDGSREGWAASLRARQIREADRSSWSRGPALRSLGEGGGPPDPP